ncbi:MAG TPA: hypothetical protein PLO50_06385, partial [Nitrospira sp.]|nr:hypothetical protein [Nitrospira sp.]
PDRFQVRKPVAVIFPSHEMPRGGEVSYPLALITNVPGGGTTGTALGQGPPATPSAWVIELRRGAGWDQGIGRPGAPAGLVVHSLRPIDEYPNDENPDFGSKAVYEGVFPLTASSQVSLVWGNAPGGDADRRFGDGAVVIRVEAFAKDLSWAEVTVGGAQLGREGDVLADFGRPAGIVSESSEEGKAQNIPIFICGKGDYRYTLSRRFQRLKSVATAFGYDQPIFSWTISGVSVGNAAGAAFRTSIRVPVTAHYPLPSGGETVVLRTATLECELEDNGLIIIGNPTDGNFAVEIEVAVREGSTIAVNPAPPSSRLGGAEIQGIIITYDSAYYEAVEACVARVQEIDDRFSKSRQPGPRPRFRLEDQPSRRLGALDRIRHDLSIAGNVALAEQVAKVITALQIRAISNNR